MRGGMKFMTRSRTYKASNVSFKPETCEAYSYDWWLFVANINGKVVFNAYNYSNSTCKHQSKVRSLLDALGISIDYTVSCRTSLSNSEWAAQALKTLDTFILESTTKLSNTRRKKSLDASRLKHLNDITQ